MGVQPSIEKRAQEELKELRKKNSTSQKGMGTESSTKGRSSGGVFDPIHNGHLIAAETVREACHLGKVLFIPASDPPHKRYPEMAPAKDRVEMVLLAILNHTQFELSSHELRRDGPSYTVATLRELRREMGEDVELFFDYRCRQCP